MRSCILLAAILSLSLAGRPSAHAEEEPAGVFPLTPTAWLVIEPVDHRSRRPFNPDRVYERHLLDPRAGPPRADGVLMGERGVMAAWKAVQPDDKGRVGGRVGYAYTRVKLGSSRVVLARLHGASTLFVNGTPVAGDVYGNGYGGLPVVLEKGDNDIYVRGVRGSFKLTFELPPAPVFVADWSRTLPDVPAGSTVDSRAGLFVINATDRPVSNLSLSTAGNAWLAPSRARGPIGLPPLGLLQVGLPLRTREGKRAPAEPGRIEVSVTLDDVAGAAVSTQALPLHVRAPREAFIRTFVSGIDGSVQKYALRMPDPTPAGDMPTRLALSLHGAGVNPRAQIKAYSSKPDFWIAAATNRRRFGFDWQDWGRLDAYEVLEEALRVSKVERRRVYLTGHSMGGHGTWHLAANDADGFAAIAPSAGWISFDTYPGPRRKGARTKLWQAADGPSLTLSLLDNLAQLPTFILHGTKDDNVPVGQARQMEQHLLRAGRKPEVHYAEGKGHWWDGKAAKGADCVDWPGIFDLFRKHEVPERPHEIKFTTWSPAVDANHHWITVWQPETYGKPSHVFARWEPATRTVRLSAVNVARLRVRTPVPPKAIHMGTAVLTPVAETSHWLEKRDPGGWRTVNAAPRHEEKAPFAMGPLRQAFRNRFLMVYPTKGTEAENRAALEQARFDAQSWYYRGNGRAEMISDVAYGQRLDVKSRNAILYGNAETNAAFSLLPTTCPIRVLRNQVQIGGQPIVGDDLGAWFVYRSAEGPMLAVMGSTGVEGARLGATVSTFVSGAGFPDYVVFSPGILTDGDGGALEAGWFDSRWRLQPSR